MPSPATLPPIPTGTAQAALTAFGKGNFYLGVGDRAGSLFDGVDLAALDRSGASPVASLMRLALATVFQFVEELPDYQAAEAARTRTDWKYALHLPMNHPGLSPQSLCDFRQELLSDGAAEQSFQSLLDRLAGVGLLQDEGDQPVGAAGVLSAVCALGRLEALSRVMRLALEGIAARRPEWLRAHALPHWYDRYDATPMMLIRRTDRTPEALVADIRRDARYLLETVATDDPPGLGLLPEVQAVRGEWLRQFTASGEGGRDPLYCASCLRNAQPADEGLHRTPQ